MSTTEKSNIMVFVQGFLLTVTGKWILLIRWKQLSLKPLKVYDFVQVGLNRFSKIKSVFKQNINECLGSRRPLLRLMPTTFIFMTKASSYKYGTPLEFSYVNVISINVYFGFFISVMTITLGAITYHEYYSLAPLKSLVRECPPDMIMV